MDTFKYGLYMREYGLYAALIGLGIGLVGVGVIQSKVVMKKMSPEIEVVKEVESSEVSMVVVDVSGAVVQPGIYRLEQSARVAEALSLAGGLAEDADLEYVAKEINLATALTDGMKVYIPKRGVETRQPGEERDEQVSINQASQTELEGLWGVGAARAQTIIENRPYSTIEELVSRVQLPQTILDKNQGKLRL